MPFRVKASEEREVGDNTLYFPDAARAASGKYSKLGEAIEDNVIKEKKKDFFR
ncbi:MAG: hypothetical protein AVDCRST_MAG96-4088 [uncultured Segetibacter sp.]|uniref:Uncharacterized protein n=1 Tax=uncultured Segetibacter sp. TaxID=481133 RepID=A0A6J4U3D0_9BACT|nr:MAG: hypothetical protein AVDCRST_MAG96-4088 [uncultured Segetibacter sp.]